jgi:hypothetical protein
MLEGHDTSVSEGKELRICFLRRRSNATNGHRRIYLPNIPTEYTYELIRDGVGVDSRGDIYARLTQERSVDKLVRTR